MKTYEKIAKKGNDTKAMKEFKVNSNDAGQRLDKFMRKALPELPLSVIYKALRTKNVKVNRKRGKNDTRLNEGDIVQVYVKDDFFDAASQNKARAVNTDIELDIVYEDGNIMIVNKPAGLPVHEVDGAKKTTLIDQAIALMIQRGEYRPDEENTFVPALCNRIDQNTGGMVIIAKNAPSLRIMNEKIKKREITKKYLCATEGLPPKKEGKLENFIEKDSTNNKVSVYDRRRSANSLTAITKYRLIERKDSIALVEAELITGRTHQIRAQFAHNGFPLVGDVKYGVRSRATVKYQHQALYSYKLSFDFESDADILEYLKGKTFTVKNVPFLEELGFEYRVK